MEKTILYSKKPFQLTFDVKAYECCQHKHCKQLVSQIKFMTNVLTQKLLKEQSLASNQKILKEKENVIDSKIRNCELNKTLQEEIQNIRKSYLKLRKQLEQIQVQNDELFQQNIGLKKKLQKFQENANLKSTFELSLTKCNETSAMNSKNSFFTSAKCDSQVDRNQSQIYQRNQQDFNQLLQTDLNIKLQGFNHAAKQNSTERSDVFNRYQKLVYDFQKMQAQSTKNEQKLQQFGEINRKLEYENSQLKKIIKLRNQIQTSRHKAIGNLRRVLDEIQA